MGFGDGGVRLVAMKKIKTKLRINCIAIFNISAAGAHQFIANDFYSILCNNSVSVARTNILIYYCIISGTCAERPNIQPQVLADVLKGA